MSKIRIEFVLDNGLTVSGIIEQDEVPKMFRDVADANVVVKPDSTLPLVIALPIGKLVKQSSRSAER